MRQPLGFPSAGAASLHLLLDALNAGGLAAERAEVVELGAADASLVNDFNQADRRGMRRENALDADAEADAANREARPRVRAALLDDHALELLDAFLIAFGFLQSDVDANGIARAEGRQVLSHLSLLVFFNRQDYSWLNFLADPLWRGRHHCDNRRL